jgi:hypothetical protein
MVRGEGCSSRTILWSNVLELIGERPLLGWGWGELDYAHYAHLYAGERFCDILDNAHNLPLQLAVELGIPLATLLICSVAWFVLRAQPARLMGAEQRLGWGVLALLLLHSLLEYPLWYGPFHTAAVLSVMLLLKPRPVKPWMVFARIGAGGVLACVLFIVWRDYRIASQPYLAPEQRIFLGKPLSGLFRNQMDFAALTTTPLTRSNAREMFVLAQRLLHYSPERRVIEVLIESLVLMGRDEEALWHVARYRAAFPDDFAAWSKLNRAFAAPGIMSP